MKDLESVVERRVAQHRGGWPGHVAAVEVRVWADLGAEVDQELHAAVQRAREAGATWANIGQALGISKAGAQQRFGRPRT